MPARTNDTVAPFQIVAPLVVRVAVGATFVQRAVKVTVRVAPTASVAVTVTGSVRSSPRVAVHDHVPLPRVTEPVPAVRVTSSPSTSDHVPDAVTAPPSGALAGDAARVSVGARLPVPTAAMTSIRRVVTVVPWESYAMPVPVLRRSVTREPIGCAGLASRSSASAPATCGAAIEVPWYVAHASSATEDVTEVPGARTSSRGPRLL